MTRRPSPALPPLVLGLAACAVVLFALGQAYLVLDLSQLARWRPLDAFLKSGNVALTVLLAISGYSATRQLLVARSRGLRAGLAVVLWYAVGVTALLVLVVGAVWLVNGVDSTDTWTAEQTRTSAEHVLTYRWNEYVAANPLTVRSDLSPLWYFSVELQLVLVAFLGVAVLGRRPDVLAGLAVVAAVGALWYRADLLLTDGWFITSLDTAARADAFLLGMAAAAVGHRGRLVENQAAGLAGGALLLLLGGVMMTSFLEVEEFFRYQGPGVSLLTAVFLVGVDHRVDDRALVVEALTSPELATVGTAWRVGLAWTVPAFLFVSRHLGESPGIFRIACAALLLAALVAATMALRSAVLQNLDRRFEPGRGGHVAPRDRSET